jgi:hypothetical protein
MASKKFLVDIDLMKNQLLNAVIQVLATAPGTPSDGQIYYSSADNTFYGYNGTTWIDLGNSGTGATNLSFSRDGSTVTVISSTGTDAVLPAATTTLAGVMSATDKTKLDGIATNANNYTHPNHTGDVTSTGDGATVIANNAVTLAKMANVATGTLFYRKTASSGNPEVQTLATLKTDLGLTGTNSGDQTSIAGITGTKAQFNTAVTDGTFLYVGDVTTNATHTGDVTGATVLTIANDVVTNAKLANVATGTIKGRVTAATGDPEDLTAAQVRTLLNVADGATANAGTVTSVNLTAGTGVSVSGGPITTSGAITVTNTAPHVATNLAQGTRTTTTVPVTSSTGSSATLDSATTSLAGVMSSADKTKLNSIETNAKDDQNAAEVPFNNTSTGFAATNVQSAIDEFKGYTDGLITGALINQGGYNAATNTPNLDVTPIAGIKNGWTYVITAAGDFFAEGVQIGDMIIAKQDNPTTLAHWTIVNKNIPDIVAASETAQGIIELATQAEVNTGTDTTRAVTPATLQSKLGVSGTLTNAVKYVTSIGNGTDVSITVTHGIGKQFNTVQVYQTGSPFAQIECEINNISTTQTTLKFNVAPTSNQYTVVITG